jgi:GNAT superfamily N-acetyltransferase
MKKFKIATTNEEKERVFRFRYEIYIQELGWPVQADHQRKVIVDQMDESGHIFYCEDEKGEIIAVSRVNLAKEGDIEFAEEYELERFKPFYPENVSTITRFMIHPSHRKTTITSALTKDLYEFGLRNNIYLDFINTHPPLDDFYKRLGYRYYKPPIPHPDFGEAIPMVLVLPDVNHLEKVRSPLIRIAREVKNPIDLEGILSQQNNLAEILSG